MAGLPSGRPACLAAAPLQIIACEFRIPLQLQDSPSCSGNSCNICSSPCLTCKSLGAQLPFRHCRSHPSGMDSVDGISHNSQNSRIRILIILIVSHLVSHFFTNYKLSNFNFLRPPTSPR
jgi:hypothetical protein